MSQTHLAGGALFTAAGLGAAGAVGWMHAPAWALAFGIAWGALAGELPDIDHRRARVSRARSTFGIAGPLLGIPVRIVGAFIRGLQVKHRGPTHSLTFLALWAPIAAPLYIACGGVMVLALAWAAGKLAAIAHTGTPVRVPAAVPWLLGYLAVVYPYVAVTTALGYVSLWCSTRLIAGRLFVGAHEVFIPLAALSHNVWGHEAEANVVGRQHHTDPEAARRSVSFRCCLIAVVASEDAAERGHGDEVPQRHRRAIFMSRCERG